MKSEDYYRISDLRRNEELKENSEYARAPEIINLFKGKEKEFLKYLIKDILKLNNLEEISEKLERYECSVKERDLDLLRVIYLENKDYFNELSDFWKIEVRCMGREILKNMPFEIITNYSERGIIHKDYDFHLKIFQSLNIRF